MRCDARYVAHGAHWLVDCFGVDATLLRDVARLQAVLCAAADDAGARRLFQHFHRFGADVDGGFDAAGGVQPDVQPDGQSDGQDGVTGVVLLAESHITIHTWPERRFAAVDLFLCGVTRPDRALARIERELAPERVVTLRSTRGE